MRPLAVSLVVVIFWSAAVLSLSATSTHGCAPPVPPFVPGSLTPVPATKGIILFNEVLSTPKSTWNCSESGTNFLTKDAWVELYNPQNQPFDLYAAHPSIIGGPNTKPFYLPFGSAIAAHGFLVVFPDASSVILTAGTHLNLVIAGVTIDQVKLPQLAGDQSYARMPDGGNKWEVSNTPTIDASNTSAQATPTSTVGNHGGNGSGTPSGTGNTPFPNGTQPAWSRLQLPAPTVTPIANLPSRATPIPSSVPPTNSGMDMPRRIAFTLLALALAGTLLWCWRLFRGST